MKKCVGGLPVSIDKLHEKIRKLKNPSMVDFSVGQDSIPAHILQQEADELTAYVRFCRELMQALKDTVPAVRFRFDTFALMGQQGLPALSSLLREAGELGYYVLLDGPGILTPWDAERTAKVLFGTAQYPCDGLLISPYIGSDAVKPFLPYCKDGKDLFIVVRSPNKSALELQDLLTGSRLVHAAAADLINRFGADNIGKNGYARVGAVAGGNSVQSLQYLRSKYSRLFLLVDDIDYSACNAKICANAFDKFGHGAVVCAGPTVTAAWKETESDGGDYLDHAFAAAERMKKNLTRYTTVL
jgi:orotidine-5'-phosphate decarboxylase